jgi:hypothetical protein
MNNFSNMSGTTPISPVSTGVWKIEKKRKTNDEKHRNSKKRKKGRDEEKEEKDLRVTLTGDENKKHDNTRDMDREKQTGYVTEKKTSKTRKIDLKI